MTPDPHVPGGIRLQKVLAQAGFGSRRASEQLIEHGRVSVDGVLVTELGMRVDPSRSQIAVDGLPVQTDPEKLVVALNKPLGMVATMTDPQGRAAVGDLVRDLGKHLFHIGRLDADSEGLLLLTNDGDLANHLTHPTHRVPKTYLVSVAGEMWPRLRKQLLAGVELDDGPAKFDSLKVVQEHDGHALVEVVLHEGRNRLVRRMFESVDRPVERLVRTRIGPIKLGELRPGRTRVLSQTEVGSLWKG